MKTTEKKPDTTMSEKAAELRRQYVREYRARNKDRVRKWNAAYWERKAAQKAAKPNDNDM